MTYAWWKIDSTRRACMLELYFDFMLGWANLVVVILIVPSEDVGTAQKESGRLSCEVVLGLRRVQA